MSTKYVFMDESGDLGFDLSKKGTSRFFSMTFLLTSEIDAFDKDIRKIFSKFNSKHIQKLGGVLHANRMDDIQKAIVIDRIIGGNFQIFSIFVDKSHWYIAEDSHMLYALIANKLLQYVIALGFDDLTFIASRRYTTKSINQKFIDYMSHSTQYTGKKLNFIIDLPSIYKGLQIADFCSRACFRKYEFGDSKYYDQLHSHIFGEYNFLL